MTTKKKICWIEDARAKISCHLNERGLNFNESYLGHIWFDMAKLKWCSLIKDCDTIEAHKDLDTAKKFVQDKVGGEPLGLWD